LLRSKLPSLNETKKVLLSIAQLPTRRKLSNSIDPVLISTLARQPTTLRSMSNLPAPARQLMSWQLPPALVLKSSQSADFLQPSLGRHLKLWRSLRAPRLSVQSLQRPTATSFRCEAASFVFGLRTARAKASGKLFSRAYFTTAPLVANLLLLQVHERTRPRQLRQSQQRSSVRRCVGLRGGKLVTPVRIPKHACSCLNSALDVSISTRC
jgi:hypothetical protein